MRGKTASKTRQQNISLLIAAALLIVLFSLLAVAISEHGAVVTFDRQAEIWLLDRMTPALATLFLVITQTGNEIFISVLTVYLGIIFLLQKEYALLTRLVLAAGGGGFLDLTLKVIFRRPRPDFPNVWVHPLDYSFPSGHAMMSIILYGLIATLLIRQIKFRRKRTLILVAASLMILIIGFSRLVLGAHYPSDILAGWSVGGAWLILSWFYPYGWFKNNHRHASEHP